MARVSIEQSVFTDPRYRVLARELGVDVWSAIGRMAAVWNHCQETNSYVLSEAIVNCLFDDGSRLSEALLKSELGKKHRHGIYISGTRGRIEWLENKRRANRENGKKGGRPKGTHEKPTNNPSGLQAETPPALALAPTKTSSPTSPTSDAEKFSEDSVPLRLATLLLNEIRKNDPQFKTPNLQKWATTFDRLVRLDKRDPKEIAKLVHWCQGDSFWRTNILSADTFREKYSALKLKASTPQQQKLAPRPAAKPIPDYMLKDMKP